MKYLESLETVNKEIEIEDIGLKITEDSLILAKVIQKKINDMKNFKTGIVLEIGAGQGIISILLSETENIKRNSLENKIFPVNKDIKEVEGEYDIIFSNPPYKKMDSGKLSQKEEELISKYEKKLTLEEVFSNIRRLLKNNGHFFVIVPDDRLNDVFSYVYSNNMNIVFLQINEYKRKKLIVVHGKKGGKKNSAIKFEINKKV